MANDDPTVVGRILVKLNGIFVLDAKSGSYSMRQTVMQHVTGGGVKTALGVILPSGSLEEVRPRQGATDWKSLKNFSMEWVDMETKKTIFEATGCNWESVDGRMDLSQASMTRSIGFKGTEAVAY